MVSAGIRVKLCKVSASGSLSSASGKVEKVWAVRVLELSYEYI